MNARKLFMLLLAAALALPAASLAQRQGREGRLYRYVDEHGVVHYADSVPPQYANRDRAILNNQGVAVGFEEGEVTAEERAALERAEAEAEAARNVRAEAQRRDRMLLETYLSVRDIEELRDRRLELLESQIKVTELYLTNLRKRLVSLHEEASRFKPYSTNENAPQVPENLSLDLSRTTASIGLYEQTLLRTRSDQENLRASFDKDIIRFKELKGG